MVLESCLRAFGAPQLTTLRRLAHFLEVGRFERAAVLRLGCVWKFGHGSSPEMKKSRCSRPGVAM
jgi:hypothetical protein